MENTPALTRRSLISPGIDFLLLGGASLLVWALMTALRLLFSQEEAAPHFFHIMLAFSWLSIVCNNPHFLISYRFGYGRGKDFIFSNWKALIAVPVAMLIIFTVAYFFFFSDIHSLAIVGWINNVFSSMSIGYRIGEVPNLGIELMGLAIRIMYITTGWHYAKQAFGCIMVYGHYHHYPISKAQRLLLKCSLFSVAIYNFFFISNYTSSQSGSMTAFINIPMSTISFPEITEVVTLWLVVLSGLLVVIGVFYQNYKRFDKLPSSAILAPWLALHFWWIPLFGFMDFFFLAVPFFHGLQYLLFAYQLEAPEKEWNTKKKIGVMALKAFLLMLVGFLAFDYVPRTLDSVFSTDSNLRIVFFFVAIPVFINIHHFFIDSVVWRFSDETIRKKLLD